MNPRNLRIMLMASACNARVAGMQAANQRCALIGVEPQYDIRAFEAESAELERLADCIC